MPGDHVEVKKTGEVDAGMIKKLAVQSSSGKVPVGTVYINGKAFKPCRIHPLSRNRQ